MAVLGWRIWARWWVFACYSFSSLRALLHPRHCESLSPRHCEERSDEAISPLLHPAIANRRVGKCAGVKQSPRCTFLLVLGVLGRLLRLIVIRLAMTRRWLGNGNFSQVNKEKKLKKNKIINQQKLNAHGN